MEFTIRPIRPEDAQEINGIRRMPGVFENILSLPSERVENSEKFIAELDQNSHRLVAVVNDGTGEKVVGCAGLRVSSIPRLRHSGDLSIMVHPDYQGQGVGSALMKALLNIADNWLLLIRVELDVFVDNESAIRMYKKFGFEVEGTKNKAAIRNGRYVNTFLMGRIRNLI